MRADLTLAAVTLIGMGIAFLVRGKVAANRGAGLSSSPARIELYGR